MNGQRHMIRSVVFDTNIATEELASRWRNTISRLDMTGLFGKALEPFDRTEVWTCIDRLEINIGDMGWEDEQEWTRKIRAALEERLAGSVYGGTSGSDETRLDTFSREIDSPGAVSLESDEFLLKGVLRYLQTGIGPWELEEETDFAEILMQLIDRIPGQVEASLRDALADREESIQRIMALLSMDELLQLVKLFSGREIVGNLLTLHKQIEKQFPAWRTKWNRRMMVRRLLDASVKAGRNRHRLLVEIGSKGALPSFLFEFMIRKDLAEKMLGNESAALLEEIMHYHEPISPASMVTGGQHDAFPQTPAATGETQVKESPEEEDGGRETGEPVFIHNAGLVLLNPALLKFYFDKLGWINENEFVSSHTRIRAISWLQFVVTGKQSAREYQLGLNKLLCGMLPTDVADIRFRLTRKERETALDLLNTVAEHWTALKKISAEGLRESLLQRAGSLKNEEGGWQLNVESKAYDILIEKLPWTYSIIKFPWMIKPLFTQWSTRI